MLLAVVVIVGFLIFIRIFYVPPDLLAVLFIRVIVKASPAQRAAVLLFWPALDALDVEDVLAAWEIGEFIRIIDVFEADATQVALAFLDQLLPLAARLGANISI
jgi:hypothetical protein